MNFFDGKRILITGAAGTIGKAMVEEIIGLKIEEVIAFDNNETELFFLKEKHKKVNRNKLKVKVGDIRDKEKVMSVAKGIDIIFHCAAYKHVIFSEFDSFDYVQVNVVGTQNIIEAAIKNDVELVVNTSSDKAVNPTNVMGATKLLSEKLITAGNVSNFGSKTKLSSVRFGNVLGSRGSIVPLVISQIKSGEPVTLTEESMSRFVMSVSDAVKLVLEATFMMKGGEVFVLKMKAVRIIDLLKAIIDLVAHKFGYDNNYKIKKIGIRPGEKLYEELMSEEEASRSLELEKMFVILPRFKDFYKEEFLYSDFLKKVVEKPYVSKDETFLSIEEIKKYLIKEKIIENCLEGRL